MTIEALDLHLSGRLAGVSASFQPGQITAICGPNGAGKSSLIAALAGLLMPDSGKVRLGGEPLLALPRRERAKLIGFLPQHGEVAWDLSVRALAGLGRLPHGDRAPQPVERALDALELADLAERPISTLSGGERARALMARLFAGEPEWILADEPFAALDLAHQLALLAHLADAARRGVGVVLVLHDLALAMNHASRVLVLDQGRVAAEGGPHEALSANVIARVWNVPARWHGEAGRRALAAG